MQPYSYAIRIALNWGYVCPFSDSIQSIFLNGSFNADSLTIALHWTPYWGWTNPVYKIVESSDGGNTFHAVDGATTSGTAYDYTRPLAKGKYIVRIETTSGSLLARSNWYKFDIVKLDLQVSNVMTPNGDNLNDAFFVENLDLYPNSKLNIYNRWGRKVYTSNNYRNDYNLFEWFPC